MLWKGKAAIYSHQASGSSVNLLKIKGQWRERGGQGRKPCLDQPLTPTLSLSEAVYLQMWSGSNTQCLAGSVLPAAPDPLSSSCSPLPDWLLSFLFI